MKALEKFASEHNMKVVKIRYRHQFGYCKRKGYDLIDMSTIRTDAQGKRFATIFASFEPVDYSNGDKWLLRHGNHVDSSYCKRITEKYLQGVTSSNFIVCQVY